MTLFVKNEHDIIIDNIFYHLARGVDEIIVTDNGSTDGTFEILQMLQDEYQNIHVLQKMGFRQEEYVNQMAAMAKRDLGASIVFHNDADEFWYSNSSLSLKDAFSREKKKAVLVRRNNVIPFYESCKLKWPQEKMQEVKKTVKSDSFVEESKIVSLFLLFIKDPKVIFSCKRSLPMVIKGNHNFMNNPINNYSQYISIYHFPFRSYLRFRDKIKMITAGYISRKKDYSPGHGWNTKRFNKIITSGKYDYLVRLLLKIPEKYQSNMTVFNYEKEVKQVCRLYPGYEKYKLVEKCLSYFGGQYRQVTKLKELNKKQQQTIEELKEIVCKKNNQFKQSKKEYDMIMNSNCWKYTGPLRNTKDFIKHCIKDIIEG